MKLAITICATEKYTYAMATQARRVHAAVSHINEGEIILVGDKGKTLPKIEQFYKELFAGRDDWKITRLELPGVADGHKNYGDQAQLVIGQLRTAAFTHARIIQADLCWSLDSDVLPPENGLRCMQQMLEFDGGYYSVSFCPYPSQGGGGYLGGRGTIFKQIADDWFEDERVVPEDLQKEMIAAREEMEAAQRDHKPTEGLVKRLQDIEKRMKECPPLGNVFSLNAKRWRQRGWLDQAYPAIGKGAIVPIDWVGFGCTLLNKRALALAHFDGYQGKGTEDLYVVWHRWYQHGLRMNCITHCPCDHVIRNPGKPGYFVHQQGFHETEGECIGHLRIRSLPWNSHEAGELYDEKNDGKILPPPKTPEQIKADEEAELQQQIMEALMRPYTPPQPEEPPPPEPELLKLPEMTEEEKKALLDSLTAPRQELTPVVEVVVAKKRKLSKTELSLIG